MALDRHQSLKTKFRLIQLLSCQTRRGGGGGGGGRTISFRIKHKNKEMVTMREQFKIFKRSSRLFRWEGVSLVKKGAKEGVLKSQRQSGKIAWENGHFALFFHLTLPKIWHAYPIIYSFLLNSL